MVNRVIRTNLSIENLDIPSIASNRGLFTGSSSEITDQGILGIDQGGTGSDTFNTNALLYYNGSEITSLGFGSSGQVLTSNGSGQLPTYQAAGAGVPAFTRIYKISNQSISDNTLTKVTFGAQGSSFGDLTWDFDNQQFNPAEGIYHINTHTSFQGATGQIRGGLFLNISNTLYEVARDLKDGGSTLNLNTTIYFPAGNVFKLEFHVLHNSGSAKNLIGEEDGFSTVFTAFKVK